MIAKPSVWARYLDDAPDTFAGHHVREYAQRLALGHAFYHIQIGTNTFVHIDLLWEEHLGYIGHVGVGLYQHQRFIAYRVDGVEVPNQSIEIPEKRIVSSVRVDIHAEGAGVRLTHALEPYLTSTIRGRVA